MIKSTKELYEKMLGTPDLRGKFELTNKTIFWNLFDGFDIQISIEPPATHFGVCKKSRSNLTVALADWHPDEETVFEQVCAIGLKGNVLVIRKNWFWTSVVYMGKEENCPYSQKKKWSWGKIYYLKAK